MSLFRRRRWILFSADNGVSVVMYRPIAALLQADPRVRLFHSMHFRRERRVDHELRENPRTFFANNGIQSGVIHYKIGRNLPVDAYITPNFSNRLHNDRARLKIQVFHGVSFKNYCIKEKALRYDRLFLPGAYHRRRYIESGLFKEGDPRLVVTGLAKLDRLARGELKRDEILPSLGLDPALKTVLFAPTGDEGNALHRFGDQIIENLRRLPINLIVKPHDHADPDKKCKVDWIERLRAMKFERFHASLGSDVVPLLAASDMLLTDASSVAFEYTVLDRPIVFMHVPEILEGENAHQFDMKTWGRKGGDIVHDPKELLELVPRLLENPNEKSEIRRAIAADLFHRPGHAAERAVAQIYRDLGMETPAALEQTEAAAVG